MTFPRISQVARSLPFDNSTNGFPVAADNVQTALESVISFNPTSNPVTLFDDFDGRMTWSPTSTGAAVASVSGGNSAHASGSHNGVARIATGTLLNTNAAISWSGNLAIGIVLGGGAADFRTLVKIPVLSTVANAFTARMGLGTSTTGAHTDGVYFQHDQTSGNWIIMTAKQSSTTTTTTSIPVVANTWIELRWLANTAGTSLEFFVDGVSAGTHSTNIPTVTGNGCGGNFQINNTTAVVAARELLIDYIYFNKIYTARSP